MRLGFVAYTRTLPGSGWLVRLGLVARLQELCLSQVCCQATRTMSVSGLLPGYKNYVCLS